MKRSVFPWDSASLNRPQSQYEDTSWCSEDVIKLKSTLLEFWSSEQTLESLGCNISRNETMWLNGILVKFSAKDDI